MFMKRFALLSAMLTALFFSTGCETLNQVLTTTAPTQAQMAGGLKDALNAGVGTAVSLLGKDGGYFNDPLVKIPFPEEVTVIANTLNNIGLGSLVTEFEKKLNRGAEEGAKLAGPIFVNAIKGMSFQDVTNVLLSSNQQAATDYFKGATSNALFSAFSPKIKSSLDQVGATKAWTDLTTAYNKIPLVRQVDTDLVRYATDKALQGLFSKVAAQESKIRSSVNSRTTDLMRQVFQYADSQRSGK